MNFFFVFDHYNYARWIPLFIEDLETLSKRVKAEFEMGRFVVNGSCHCLSSLPINRTHGQMNKKIKGVWVSHWSHGNSSNVREIDNCWPRTMQSSWEIWWSSEWIRWIATPPRRYSITETISLLCQRFNWCYPCGRQSMWKAAERASIPGRWSLWISCISTLRLLPWIYWEGAIQDLPINYSTLKENSIDSTN